MSCHCPLVAKPCRNNNGNISFVPIMSVNDQNADHYLGQPVADADGAYLGDYRLIPCGQCVGCRLDYSRTWANRMVMESLMHPQDTCLFVTLTYDDEHLPTVDHAQAVSCVDRMESILDSAIELDSGGHILPPLSESDLEFLGISPLTSYRYDDALYDLALASDLTRTPGTIRYRDFQLFMKRLRKNVSRETLNPDIRYYVAAEYGEKYRRPHFHVIFFGLDLPDLELNGAQNVLGQKFYRSDFLSSCWPNGMTCIALASWHTMAYTARYVMKKAKGVRASSLYAAAGIAPEQCHMSLKPAIGYDFFRRHYAEIYDHDRVILPARDGKAQVIQPPKVFDDWFTRPDLDDDLDARIRRLDGLKDTRARLQAERLARSRSETSVSLSKFFQIRAENHSNAIKALSESLSDC